MNIKDLQRPLTHEEIDFRIQSINGAGYATILAYKDARADMNRLDEVFGVLGWQRKHEVIDGRLYCSVGVFNSNTNEWIWKQDVGTESNTEKEKGQASDAFKRACFNLGIGRELYEYPIMQIKLNDDEWDKSTKRQTYNLKLRDWRWFTQWENGKLTYIGAKDQNGKLRFSHGKIS